MLRRLWGKRLALALVLSLGILLLGVGVTLAAPADSTESSCGVMVYKGQTLSGIAARYGVSVHALAAYNGIANPDKVYAGQCLRIPPRTYKVYYPTYNCYNCGCWNCGYYTTYVYHQPQPHWVWVNGCWVLRYY